jgi:hypothetical protein
MAQLGYYGSIGPGMSVTLAFVGKSGLSPPAIFSSSCNSFRRFFQYIIMASSVFYKWASRKDESRVTFDGTGISVFDLKREIILANNMSKANDFELYIYDTTSKQGMHYWCCPDWHSSLSKNSEMIHRLSPDLHLLS